MSKPRCSGLLLLALVAAACGSSTDDSYDASYTPLPECMQLDIEPCDVRRSDCQQRLLALAACLRHEDAGAMPVVSIMTESEYAQLLTQQASEAPAPDQHHLEVALGALGLAKPGSLSESALLSDRAKFTWGLFRSEQKDVLIIDHGVALDDPRVTAALLHEFVHFLQDRDVDLATFADAHTGSFDVRLAARAVVEGEARLHETHYFAAALGLKPAEVDWPLRFQNALELDEQALLSSDSSYVSSSRTFPYEWGARYMNFVWQEGSLAGALDRFVTPPAHTHTLMASVDSAETSEVPVTSFEPLVAPVGWSEQDSDKLGAWGVFLALFPRTSAFTLPSLSSEAVARELSLAWRGDSLAVYVPTDARDITQLSWRVAFADPTRANIAGGLVQGLLGPACVRRQGMRLAIAWDSSGDAPPEWLFGP